MTLEVDLPSSLPSDLSYDKSVKDLGIGPYDAELDEKRQEALGNKKPRGESLPSGGGPIVPDAEVMTSYPMDYSGTRQSSIVDDIDEVMSFFKKTSKSKLPGDDDVQPRSPKPIEKNIVDSVPTEPIKRESESKLPSGEPVARADYYDKSVAGSSIDDMWSKDNMGAYISNETQYSIPHIPPNDVSLDDYLNALGNAWSGYVVEDKNVTTGFPNSEFKENAVFEKSNDGSLGKIIASFPSNKTGSAGKMNKMSTNINLVGDLTSEFMKEYGKKDIVRRHVIAFLQKRNLPHYLASDIIRCLKFRHSITIPDVMDLFPVAKTASNKDYTLSKVHDKLIQLWIESDDPRVSTSLRDCAMKIAKAIFDLESYHG